MSISSTQQWRALLQELQPNAPLRNMNLYVKPKRSSTDEVVRSLRANPTACKKFLLVGARGGGKSTELRAIRERLQKDNFLLAEIDLDQSGILAASVSAYDLLYVSSLALLRHIADEESRKECFRELAARYAGNDPTAESGLGDWKTALEGISGFATTATAAATAAGLVPGIAPIVGSAMALGGKGLRLLGAKEVVPESSPRGRGLQDIAVRIGRLVREQNGGRPLCVLIDGLEKMNGEATERFHQVFVQTRLLADTEWSAVIAAPPCTLTETSSVEGQGFKTHPVYGFGPDSMEQLRIILELRFKQAGLEPSRDVAEGGLVRIVDKSGGLPRHAIAITEEAVERAYVDSVTSLTDLCIEEGIRAFAQALGRGLTEEHLRVLVNVRKTGRLPGERAASLFADGRILVYPPTSNSALPYFVVHPLLIGDVEGVDRGEPISS